MASITQRGRSWRAKIRLHGHNLSATFDTRDEARAWATQQEAAILEGAKPGEGRLRHITVADLLRRYRDEVSPLKRGERWEVVRLDMLLRDPLFEMNLAEFGPEQMASWRDERRQRVSSATVSRELNLISGVFQTALREWRIGLRENPVRLIKRPPAAPPRTRRVSDAEVKRLRTQLGWDGESRPTKNAHWAAWMVDFAIETAMRRGEILGLTPDRVHIAQRYVELLAGQEKGRAGQTKTGEGRKVPLSSRAVALLLLAQPWDEGGIVPLRPGNFDQIFMEAKAAVGLADLHFHDTRREALTRMAPRLGDPLHLARVSGHKNPKQLLEYFAPDPIDLAKRLG